MSDEKQSVEGEAKADEDGESTEAEHHSDETSKQPVASPSAADSDSDDDAGQDADASEEDSGGADEDQAEVSGAVEWHPHPILSPKKAWALVILSAVLCPVGFVGIDVWPLAFIAWMPLIVALRGQTPKRALLMGWVAGFGMTMIGFYWLIDMLEVFSGFPLPLCVLFAAILCLQKGGRIALCGWHAAKGIA